VSPVLAFVLLIVFPAGAAYVQSHLNKVWATQAGASTRPRRMTPELVASP
jgi:hypothetical protein